MANSGYSTTVFCFTKKDVSKSDDGYKLKNDIVFDGVPYEVIINIRDKGKEQYEYLIEFHKEKTPNHSDTVFKENFARSDWASNGYIPYNDAESQEKNRNALRIVASEDITKLDNKDDPISILMTITVCLSFEQDICEVRCCI